jgi:hypothetical protein
MPEHELRQFLLIVRRNESIHNLHFYEEDIILNKSNAVLSFSNPFDHEYFSFFSF